MNISELDDFKAEINKQGFDVDDFDLEEIDLTDWNGHQVVSKNGTVTVTRKSTQNKNTYNTGLGSHWIIDFLNDLNTGFYGTK